MKDDLRRVLRKQGAHARFVAHVGDQGKHVHLRARASQLPVDLEQRELGALDEKNLRRLEARDLTRELRADGPAGPGDHHALSGQELAELRLVEEDGLAAQQILDLDVADARHLHLALENLVEARDDPHRDLDLAAQANDAKNLLAGNLGDRDDHLGDSELLDEARQVLARAQDPDPVDHRALLLWVVVDETLHVEVHVSASRDLAGREDPGTPGPDEERRHALAQALSSAVSPLDELVEVAPQNTETEDAAEGEHGSHDDDRERHLPLAEACRQRQPRDGEGEGRPDGGVEKGLHLAHADVSPDEAVDAGQRERPELDQDDVGKLLDGVAELLLGEGELEPEQVGQDERHDERRQVEDELKSPRQLRLEELARHTQSDRTPARRRPPVAVVRGLDTERRAHVEPAIAAPVLPRPPTARDIS